MVVAVLFNSGSPFGGGRFAQLTNIGSNVSNNVLSNWDVPEGELFGEVIFASTVNDNSFHNLRFGSFQDFVLMDADDECRNNTISDLFFEPNQGVLFIRGLSAINNMFGDSLSTDNIQIKVNNAGSSFRLIETTHQIGNTIAGISVNKAPTLSSNSSLQFRCITGYGNCVDNTIGSASIEESINVEDGIETNFYAVASSNNDPLTPKFVDNCLVSNITIGDGTFHNNSRFIGLAGDTVVNSMVKNISADGFLKGIIANVISEHNLVDNISVTSGSFEPSVGINSARVYNSSVSNIEATNKLFGIHADESSQLGRGTIVENQIFNLHGNGGCGGIIADYATDTISGNSITTLTSNERIDGIEAHQPFIISNNTLSDLHCLEVTFDDFADIIIANAGVGDLCVIKNNSITNVTTTGSFRGINMYGGTIGGTAPVDSIFGNYLSNVSCNAGYGIRGANTVSFSSTFNLTIYDNVIQDITVGDLPGSNGNSVFDGIQLNGAYQVSNLVANNNLISAIRNFDSGGETSGIVGANTAVNNIIRLGMDENGDSDSNQGNLYGIELKLVGNIHHNSVYLNSKKHAGDVETICMRKTQNDFSAPDLNVSNNIFMNASSNDSTGTGNHYTYMAQNAFNQSVSHNIFHANGVGGILASFNGGNAPLNTLTEMQSAMLGEHEFFICNGPALS